MPPTEEAPFQKLITMGVGAHRMNVPAELSEYDLEHAELVIYLPPGWNISSPDENDYWPIRQLKAIGRLPIQNNTWLGYGHTVHGNADMSSFADNTGFNSMLLLAGTDLNYERLDLRLSSGKKINFYQLFPLYQEELEFKMENSVQKLMDMFSDEDIVPVINIKRRNYCI